MIRITCKAQCCGCNACVQICPVHCISQQIDHEGFVYPLVDSARCLQCGLCDKVCPVLHPTAQRKPLDVKAVRSLEESTRLQSSSGGLFTELARWVLEQGGVVFGALFSDQWMVEHGYAETEKGLEAFRGSKYVQSSINQSFKEVRTFLKQGRWVLFSGTSCQVSALHHFLRSESDRFLTVYVVCHGVLSAKVWQTYLNELSNNAVSQITQIQFRNKQKGWKNYSFFCEWDKGRIQEPFKNNLYMKAYLSDSLLRPSCYQCPCKSFASGSDLTLADYWGVQELQPELDDDRGLGLAFVHTERMREILQDLPLVKEEVSASLGELQKYNPSIGQSVSAPLRLKRFLFYRLLGRKVPFVWLVNVLLRKRGIVGFLKSIMGKK